VLEAFVQSDLGEMTYNAHKHLNVPLTESQTDWTPLQRNFLFLAHDEYGPDTSSVPNKPSSI